MPLRSVLIVDDVTEDRLLFRRLLASNTEYTYRFLEAGTGSQCLELCRVETPDCLLVDYELPDMSGTQVLQSIVTEFGLDRLPIVMLSGDGGDGGINSVVAALRIGAQDFLVKDRLRAEDLHRAISNAIEKAALRQQRIKAEREIHESEARYQSALTAGRMGTWETDLVARTRMWSKEGMALFGLALVGGLGQVGGDADEYRLALHPDDRHLVQHFNEQADGQDSFAAEYRIVRPDGAILWLAGRGQVVAREPSGKAHRLVSIMADVTERKAAEDDVHVSEIRYRRLFEAAHDGVLLLDPDTRKIIDANPFMTQLLGYSHEQLVGKELFEIGLLKDEAASQEMFQKLTREHQVRYEDLPLESQGGRNKEVEVVANLYDENGRFVIQCNIRDITDRKHLELSLALLAEISQDLVQLKSIDEMMQRVGAKIGNHLNLSGCAFMEFNEAADEAVVTHEWHRADAPSLARVHRISDFVTGEFHRASRAGEMFICHDTSADPRTDAAGYAAIHVGSFVSVPLIRAGEWLATFWVADSQPRAWTNIEVELMRTAAERTWLAIENARLQAAMQMLNATLEQRVEERTAKLHESQLQLRALSAYAERLREDERTRIAREVHDQLGGSLTGLKMSLARAAKGQNIDATLTTRLQDMSSQIDDLVQTVRRIASDLRPPLLDDFGLMAALEWQAHEWEKQTGILCHLTLPSEEVMLDREHRTAVFRVFQESLTNVARHSQATQVDVTVQKESGQLVLTVQDNGLGIGAEALLPGKSLGLLGMRERMREVSGDLDIHGAPGEGTTVTIRLSLA